MPTTKSSRSTRKPRKATLKVVKVGEVISMEKALDTALRCVSYCSSQRKVGDKAVYPLYCIPQQEAINDALLKIRQLVFATQKAKKALRGGE